MQQLSEFKSPVYLSDFDGSRTNNLTAIRITLAWLVLYGHSFAIAKLPGVADPLRVLFQGSVWIGELAVNGFFALSGFLVTGSLIKRGSIDYLISRVLRIYPALLVCVFVSVLLMGPLVSKLAVPDYFAEERTWMYLCNAFGVFPMKWDLPGVFTENVRPAVNGSLWTLTVEVRCYLLLFIIGLSGLLHYGAVANLALVAIFVFALYHFQDLPLIGIREKWSRPGGYFLLGVFLWLNRDMLPIDGRIATGTAIIMFSSFGQPWFDWVFAPCFVYILIFLAYGPRYLNVDERVGDISYGIYIYAWPVQQLIILMIPGIHPYIHFVLASAATIPIALASWRYIERPSLRLKLRLMKPSV